MIKSVIVKNNIDFRFDYNMFKPVELISNKFNEFQCGIFNFDEIIFTPRLCNIGTPPWKTHAQHEK